jgi:O-methyltransferase involved in polyketide biosynthesis
VNLPDVSRTAIITLRCRVTEAGIINDPMARYCLDTLAGWATPDEKALLFDKPQPRTLTNPMALRARKYDAITNDFIAAHPGCSVVNLGCGFDTRYWRIDNTRCRYIELDLPEVVEVKRALLGDRIEYELIGGSVLDPSWIDAVTEGGHRHFLLLAEGLFMYLPRPDVIGLFQTIAQRFTRSQITFEVVKAAYTRGVWKKIVRQKMQRQSGVNAGAEFNYGVKNAREIETYADGLRVLHEWSFVEDPDCRPRFYKYLGVGRTQWTVTASINAA